MIIFPSLCKRLPSPRGAPTSMASRISAPLSALVKKTTCFLKCRAAGSPLVFFQVEYDQWPFQDPKLEVPTIYKAYVREYPPKKWPYMVQYLQFRILEFPLIWVCGERVIREIAVWIVCHMCVNFCHRFPLERCHFLAERWSFLAGTSSFSCGKTGENEEHHQSVWRFGQPKWWVPTWNSRWNPGVANVHWGNIWISASPREFEGATMVILQPPNGN